jgi:hypothetical protein
MTEEKKKSNKILIAVNIIAVVIIIAIASYFIFFNNESQGGIASNNSGENVQGAGGSKKFNPSDMDPEDICESFQERGQRERPENIDREMPEGFDPNNVPQDLSDRKNVISEICDDGKVSEEEKKELEEMQNSMPTR